jgi:integrase
VRLRSNSPYFMADYTAADGTRRRVSTGKTNRHDAEQFLASLLAAEKLAREDRLTEARARELISEIVERSTGERLQFFTVRGWFNDWLLGKELSKAGNTVLRYKTIVDSFLMFLGPAADKNLETLRTADIARFFKSEREKGKGVLTCTLAVKVIKSALRSATKIAGLKQNPADGFEIPQQEGDSVEREIFTPEDVNRLMDAAGGDWAGVIRLSYFTGMRLGDCVNLQWKCVDLGRKVIEFTPRKTANRVRPGGKPKRIAVPLHPHLESALSAMVGADGSPDAFLFPSLAGKSSAGRSGLSMAFSQIMKKAGVDAGVRREKAGKAGRIGRARTFHSLRHSFVSALANAGVPLEHRRLLAGHVEATMTEAYTHTDVETLRAGVDKLPGLGGI